MHGEFTNESRLYTYLPYPELSGEIQKGRLILWAPRCHLMIKFADDLRPRVVNAVGQLHRNNIHDDVQWLLSHLKDWPVCFMIAKTWPIFKLNTYQQRLENGDKLRLPLQLWPISYNPIPYFTWYRYAINSFNFSQDEVEMLLLRDPKQFLELCRVVFFQAKLLADVLQRKFQGKSELFLEESVELFVSDILAYSLTVEPSLKALELDKLSHDYSLKATIDLINCLEISIDQHCLSFYSTLLAIERLIFLDDHPIKLLLRKMMPIEIYQSEYEVISIPSNPKECLLKSIQAKGVISRQDSWKLRSRSIHALSCAKQILSQAFQRL